MYHLFTTLVVAGLLLACQQQSQPEQAAQRAIVVSDSAAVADVVHGFYKWYTAFSQKAANQIDFTDDNGPHLTLNQEKLERYLARFAASNFVSREFIANEVAFYRQCSQWWQHEPIDDVPSCLDADRYFCAQEWEPDFWLKSPVRIRPNGPDRVTATLVGQAYGSPMERTVELKKEEGKWLIANIECDMGLSDKAIDLKRVTINEAYIDGRIASHQPMSPADARRMGLDALIADDLLNVPGTRLRVLDTLFATGRGRLVVVARDSENEREAWLVQYDASPRLVFWVPVYYDDLVEYLKTIETTVAGQEVAIRTTTDIDGTKSVNVTKYALNRQLIFERINR
ncbi:hypothetical protein FAES_1653 [Fibrella aestuarina BUZ 2]|uniref:DUF3828 domain-containing protein n=1 Tax=Fibrella aestuarina BUZ 2 TaxID=1166018 RepID=I0K6B0_9BACT|nr:YbjP/YqhG family protein [Fibrella aestuarina]CCG99663.1 hypothetical protein FAES_1653 [Fibrella aestuarina BUZ 2]